MTIQDQQFDCDLFDDKSLVYVPLCKHNNISPKQTSISHCQHQNRRAVLILPIRLIGLRESSPNQILFCSLSYNKKCEINILINFIQLLLYCLYEMLVVRFVVLLILFYYSNNQRKYQKTGYIFCQLLQCKRGNRICNSCTNNGNNTFRHCIYKCIFRSNCERNIVMMQDWQKCT